MASDFPPPDPSTDELVPLDRLMHLGKPRFPWWVVWILLIVVSLVVIAAIALQMRPPKLVNVEQPIDPSHYPAGPLDSSPADPGESYPSANTSTPADQGASDPPAVDPGPASVPAGPEGDPIEADGGSAPAEAPEASGTPLPAPGTPLPTPGGSDNPGTGGRERMGPARAVDQQLAPELQGPIFAVRQALALRDLPTAGQLLQSASLHARRPADRLQIERLALARFRLKRFWQAVQTASESLAPGQTIPWGDQTATVIQRQGDQVELEIPGEGRMSTPLDTASIDPYLAAGLAELELRPQGAAYLIDLGLFWALDQFADPERARFYLEAAQRQGLGGQIFLPQAELPDSPPEGVAADPRTPVPSPHALAAAQTQVEEVLGPVSDDPQEAAAQGAELARQALELDANPAAQYVLLQRAVQAAVEGADVAGAMQAVDHLVARFQIPMPERGYRRTAELLLQRNTQPEIRQQIVDELVARGQRAAERGDPGLAGEFASIATATLGGEDPPPSLQELRATIQTP